MTDPTPNQAEIWARVTGSVGATHIVEKRNPDGTLTEVSRQTYGQVGPPAPVPARPRDLAAALGLGLRGSVHIDVNGAAVVKLIGREVAELIEAYKSQSAR